MYLRGDPNGDAVRRRGRTSIGARGDPDRSAGGRGVARLVRALGVVSGILTAALLGLDPPLLTATVPLGFAVPLIPSPVPGGIDVLHESAS